MAATPHQSHEVRALNFEMGGDDDLPGIAQELTYDDVDDIAFDPDVPREERVMRLTEIASELESRRTSDFNGDASALLDHVRDRLASLDANASTEGTLASLGMDADELREDDDPADRLDAAGDGEDPALSDD